MPDKNRARKISRKRRYSQISSLSENRDQTESFPPSAAEINMEASLPDVMFSNNNIATRAMTRAINQEIEFVNQNHEFIFALTTPVEHMDYEEHQFNEQDIRRHDCGPISEVCEFCQAKHFRDERPFDRKFTSCCHKGKVNIIVPKDS